MAETRTTTIHMDANTRTNYAEVTGYNELNRALGYLATWNMSFAYCEIFSATSDVEMTAHYRKTPDGPVEYVIGAIWHVDHESPNGGHFGFHS